MSDKYDESQRRKTIAPIIALALFLWCANFYFAIYFPWGTTDNTNRGTFGDVFGVVNSIFSGFAFIGVAWSISMQRDELRITREDRDDTRRILDAQQTNLEQQNESNKIARFETTFFQLFQSFRDVISGFSTKEFKGTYWSEDGVKRLVTTSARTGHGVFETYCNYVSVSYRNSMHAQKSGDERASTEALNTAFIKLLFNHGDNVGRYFRTLYTLLRFVEESDLEDEQKRFYTKLVRAQLSKEESTLLVYNVFSPHTTDRFNGILKKYGMLKNSDHNDSLVRDLWPKMDKKYFGRTLMKHSAELNSGSA